MTTRVGVFGAGGRMGSTVCRAVAATDDLDEGVSKVIAVQVQA